MHEKGFEMNTGLIERKFELDGIDVVYRSVRDQMAWGEGSITRPDINEEQDEILFDAFKKSLVKVDQSAMSMSGCTDGRFRVQMMDGSEAPILQKTVGCDVIELFIAAEVLGSKFYGSSTNSAPTKARLQYLLEFMKSSGLTPSTHVACGAREGLVPVINNFVKFASDDFSKPAVLSRISEFSDTDFHEDELSFTAGRLKERKLDDYDADGLQQEIINFSGKSAVKELLDDGEGVHGHVEASIDHISIPGYAFSTRIYRETLQRTLPDLSQLQRFTVNDDRNNDLASMIADNKEDRRLSLIAIHGFADAGHATLSKGLPTNIVRLAA